MSENAQEKPQSDNLEQQNLEELLQDKTSTSEQQLPLLQPPEDAPISDRPYAEMGSTNPELASSSVSMSLPSEQQALASTNEAEQPRAQVVGFQDQQASIQPQVSSLQGEHNRLSRERGGCLTAWLVFMGIGVIFLTVQSLAIMQTVAPLGVLILALAALDLAGIVGTWQLKKWGVCTILTLQAFGLLFGIAGLANGSSAGSFVASLVGLGIFCSLVFSRWEIFE